MMRRLPQDLEGASPDMAGQDLQALLQSLSPEGAGAGNQAAQTANQVGETLLRRRLPSPTPAVKTDTQVNLPTGEQGLTPDQLAEIEKLMPFLMRTT